MRPGSDRLFAALEAGWPPVSTRQLGPFVLRSGGGGGQRVAATTVHAPFTATDLSRALAGMQAAGGPQVFQILPSQAPSAALDRLLADRGWQIHDPVSLYLAPVQTLSAIPLGRAAAFTIWPPLAIQREIWAGDGIGPARLAVMERASVPRTSVLGRCDDRPAGTAYVAVSDGIAGLHALVVDEAFRRKGTARHMLGRAGRWAESQGAGWLALAVTRQNSGARALYTSLGMAEVEQYHYRIPGEGSV